MKWPVFTLKRNGKRVALNPDLVSALHEQSDEVTEVYTLDCSKDDDAWDVLAPFDEVVKSMDTEVVINVEAPPPTPEPSDELEFIRKTPLTEGKTHGEGAPKEQRPCRRPTKPPPPTLRKGFRTCEYCDESVSVGGYEEHLKGKCSNIDYKPECYICGALCATFGCSDSKCNGMDKVTRGK